MELETLTTEERVTRARYEEVLRTLDAGVTVDSMRPTFLRAQLKEDDAERAWKISSLNRQDAQLRRSQLLADIRRERLREVRPGVLDALKHLDAKLEEAAEEHRSFVDTLRRANAAVGLGPSPIGALDIMPFAVDDVHFGQSVLMFMPLADTPNGNRLTAWRDQLRADGRLS